MLALFPYDPRPAQAEIVEAATSALEAGAHFAFESGTGTGKTVCALTAALSVARSRGKRVLYLTRTNAQERQVVLEYRKIRARAPEKKGVAIALQGRAHLCPLRGEDPEMARANSEELGTMCRDRCKASDDARQGKKTRVPPCRFYEATRTSAGGALAEWTRAEAPTAEELVAESARRGLCPYVASRDLLTEAELVVAPYVYFLEPFLRRALFSWIGASAEDFVLVVDEAHNVPDFARDLASGDLGEGTIALARREAEEFGNPEMLDGFTLVRMLDAVSDVLGEIAGEHLLDGADDALVPKDHLDATLLGAFRVATPTLDRAIAAMQEYGAAVREARRREGRLPRSYVGAVASFLVFYRQADDDTHVRLVSRDANGAPRLECYAVDASVATRVVLDTAGSLHMSGTLAPLEEYRDSIGLPPATPLAAFPSPFPPENRLLLFDPDVTTRYDDLRKDPGMWRAIGERVRALRDAAPERNLAVFVPSYEALERVAPALAGTPVVREPRGATQEEIMREVERFKAARGATLLSVMGGKLSEGLDFPDAELEMVAVVGLPYPKPSARQEALVRFYDRRFGRGWDYASRAPMVRKVLQSVGRLIRTPTDRGVAVVLDRRAALLRAELPRLRATRALAEDARDFFAHRLAREDDAGGGFTRASEHRDNFYTRKRVAE